MSAPALAGIRLLLVDDDHRFRDIVTEVFARAGAAVTTAASVEEARAVFDREVFDVVIADLVMPGIGGSSLLEGIRRRPPDRGGAVPVIAVSGLALDDGPPSGFSAHLAKPVDVATLLGAVRAVLAAPGGRDGDRAAAG
jgi:CheY-like chemotaxis protein